MKMNPAEVYRFESNAERKLFRLFERTNLEQGTTFHSLNIPEHERKQFAEADFVVVSNRGVLVLEVKGGRLSVRQGIWYTKDAEGNVKRLKESPLNQVKSAWEALRDLLTDKNIDVDLSKVNFGFGLMFPDVKLGDVGIELPRTEVFDAVDWDRKNLQRWLEKLYKHWSEKTGKKTRLGESEVSAICSALRGEFDREKSLLAEVGDSWEQLISLTEQQYFALDTILANDQVIVEGGAGAGKTLVAMKAAKALAASGKKVLFVCRSPVLTSFIKRGLGDHGIEVVKFSTLQSSAEAKREFDCLVVDEGQDMLDMESILTIDGLFADGMSKGSWYFFMDPNNQASLYAEMDDDARTYLRSCGVKVPLKKNCRNTRQIAIHTLLYTGGDIGQCRVVGEGLPVLEKGLDHISTDHLVDLINLQLEKWIDDEDVNPGDITILSPIEYEQSCIQGIDKRWRRKLTVINENYGERWGSASLAFSTIRDFKGLENKYVMLVDLSMLPERENAISEFYVAMTRANTVLWMSVPAAIRSWFDKQCSQNAESLATYMSTN